MLLPLIFTDKALYDITTRGKGDVMTFETERLTLRPWQESDAQSLFEYAKDPRVGPIAGWPVHTSAQNSLETIRTVLSSPETYAVCLKEDNKAIGSIGLKLNGSTDMTSRDDECELGYWIGVPFWGQGLIPEAARALLRHGFVDLGMTTIWCGYFDGNEKSKRVQEKLGFVYQWTTEGLEVPLTGDVRTGHVNALTFDQWKSGLVIRQLSEREKASACDLAWKVFLKYEAPVYSQEGTDEFRATLDNPDLIGKMIFCGALENDKLVGMLATRQPQHISLFFVNDAHQKKGLGRKLFEFMKQSYSKQEFTVYSSPYAVEVYEHLGFSPTDTEQLTNGIRYTPMKYEETF